MELAETPDGHDGWPLGDRRARHRVAHPDGQFPRDSGARLNVDDFATAAARDSEQADARTVEGMPRVVDHDLVQSVCRMSSASASGS